MPGKGTTGASQQKGSLTAVLGGFLALYALWLLATLPASPMEWDEVNFRNAVRQFDLTRHAPHPPGYPVYVALAKGFAALGASPERAPQLASVVGALLALGAVALCLLWAGLPPFVAVFVVLGLACYPAFAFAANVGLSDMLATGLALVCLALLLRLWQSPSAGVALALGALAALACGARPQVALLLLFPAALVAAALSRKRCQAWLWALVSGLVASLLIWGAVLYLTGWKAYWRTSAGLASWMQAYEYMSRWPAMEFGRFVEDWLVRPFGSKKLALAFAFLALGGAWRLWQKGQRDLVLVSLSASLGYLLLAPWSMSAEAVVRYALPGYAAGFLCLAGWLVGGRWWLGAGMVAAYAWASFTWVLPALTLRAAEPNPVWAALKWVEEHRAPQEVFVQGGIRPHAEAVLPPAGFRVKAVDVEDLHRHPGLWVVSPARQEGQVLFQASWRQRQVGQMARRRYLSAAVLQVGGAKSGRRGVD